MIKFSTIAAAALIASSVAGCSGNEAPDSEDVTETRMDDVDVIDGTISDDMVDVDTIQQTDPTGTEEAEKADAEKEAGGGEAAEPAEPPAE
ncbi:hypothetical protein [Parasphingorhabdus sp.]|uniref:hypothetical protein n=1 Tax=Parasphingorhabdus sp. TaxID=2709688 RepID=UPI0030034466